MVSDYRPVLEAAGFTVEIYDEALGWPEPMTTTYSAIIEAKEALTQEMGEAATGALLLEMSLTLEHQPYSRRVFVAATRR